ncbi:MAG: glycerol-3-phosphate dehydrogenase C-terminal domain-containing protein, partial [Chloroflexota bacterium]
EAGLVVDATGALGSGGGSVPSFTAAHDRVELLRSRGVHLVLPRDRIRSSEGLTIRVPGRVVFVIPWGDVWLLGTTDRPHVGTSERPTATPDEAAELLSATNQVTDANLTLDDALASFAGVRPLVAGDGSSTVKTPRTHAIREPSPGLLVIRGGKFTTHGTMAREILDRGRARSSADGRGAGAARHDRYVVGGAGAAAAASRVDELAATFGVDAGSVGRLVERYGDEVTAVLELGLSTDLLRPLDPDRRYLEVEVAWAIDAELALDLDDILARRLRVAIEYRDHGASFAARAAAIAGSRLGWDPDRQVREVADYAATAAREYDVPR